MIKGVTQEMFKRVRSKGRGVKRRKYLKRLKRGKHK